jgi:hypothetical protein
MAGTAHTKAAQAMDDDKDVTTRPSCGCMIRAVLPLVILLIFFVVVILRAVVAAS